MYHRRIVRSFIRGFQEPGAIPGALDHGLSLQNEIFKRVSVFFQHAPFQNMSNVIDSDKSFHLYFFIFYILFDLFVSANLLVMSPPSLRGAVATKAALLPRDLHRPCLSKMLLFRSKPVSNRFWTRKFGVIT